MKHKNKIIIATLATLGGYILYRLYKNRKTVDDIIKKTAPKKKKINDKMSKM